MYPAVESLERLAGAVLAEHPGQGVLNSCDAEFLRFLPIPPGAPGVEAVAEIVDGEGGAVAAALSTVARAGRGTVSRLKDHIRVTFKDGPPLPPFPLDAACAAEGVCFSLPAEKLYAEMVRFGPSYRNAVDTVYLSRQGALGTIRAPSLGPPDPPLGSPFVLDAALHVACAWGQRFKGCVAFPVGYARRTIIRPAEAGGLYHCHVVPAGAQGDTLSFDIRVYAGDGGLCEVSLGVRMKDVFKGKMSAPAWARAGGGDELRAVRERCMGMSVVESASLFPFADRTLSRREAEEGRRRRAAKRHQFMGSRIALKRLARSLYGADTPQDPSLIETISPDGSRPACLPQGTEPRFFISASHDDRFSVAVGGPHPLGVDVERVTDTVLKATHIYMTPSEEKLCSRSPLGRREAALRVWSSKECAAKALNVSLTVTWSKAEMREIGEERSLVSVDGRTVEAAHAAVDDHLFTLLEILRT